MQTLIKNWWLLGLSGILDGIFSVTYLIMQDQDGSLTLRKYASKGTVLFLGKIAIASGACTIAAATWRSIQSKCWLMVLNGLALCALGLIFNGVFGVGVALRTIAGLLAVMAISFGVFELNTARTLGRNVLDKVLLGLAGAASVGFAFAILWIEPVPGSPSHFLWIGAYFGFSAVCMMGLSLFLLAKRA